MTITTKTLVAPQNVENAATTKYVSPAAGKGTLIDKATLTNYSAGAVTVSVHLVPPSGAAADSNVVIKDKSLAAKETYACPELAGKFLDAGGSISWQASAGSSVSGGINGREIT